MLNKIDRIIAIIIYSTLPAVIVIMVLSTTMFIKQDIQIRKEHTVYKQSLEALGVGGFTDLNYKEEYSAWIELLSKKHGLNKYTMQFKWSIFPVEDLENSYVVVKEAEFGKRRLKTLDREDFHTGVDISSPYNRKCIATAKGKIHRVGYNKYYGNFIYILHENGYFSFYGHLNNIYVKKDQEVKQGEWIGNIGNSGDKKYCIGSPLHFQIERWASGHAIYYNPVINSTHFKQVVLQR